jgi:hypothetical protein
MYRHPFDAVSFFFGVLFTLFAVAAPLREHLPDDMGLWLVPGALVLLGIGIAISAIATARSDEG